MTNSGRSTHKREALVLLAALCACGAAFLRPSIRGNDGPGHYVYLRSILIDGDIDFSDEYRDLDLARAESWRFSDARIHPATGLPANRYGVGAAIFWAPAVVPVHLILERTAPEAATGWTAPYEWAVGAASAFWASLGIWLLFVRIRRAAGRFVSWTTIALLPFATSLGFYMWAHGSMAHGVGFFLSVVATLAFERAVAGGLGACMACGLASGLLALSRMQDATWTIALGAALAVFRSADAGDGNDDGSSPAPAPEARRRSFARGAARMAAFGAGAALGFAPQLAAWRILYGSWTSGPLPYFNQGGGNFEPWPAHLPGVLFGQRGGVFAWHPVLLAGVAGLILARRRGGDALVARSAAVAGLLGLALQLWLVSSWSMWWGGASFGNRFFVSSYPWLALGGASLVARFESRRRSRIALAGLAAGLILWNAGLLVQYGTETIPREEAVGWATVVRNQFVEVPRWILDRVRSILP